MVTYVCKYTPTEIFAGFGGQCELLDSLANDFDVAGRLSHDNLCGFGKAMLQDVLEKKPEALVLTACCDTMKRLYEVIEDQEVCDFSFLIDLPHRQNCCGAEKLAGQFKKLINKYEKYTGQTFDREAFIRSCTEDESCEEGGPYIGILGVRCGAELENTIKTVMPGTIKNHTCTRSRRVVLDRAMLENLDFDALLLTYAEAVLAQFPCGRMGLGEKRRELLEDPNLKGIIYHTIKFCDYYEMEYTGVKQSSDLPVLKLETDCTRQSEGQLKTRIEAFAETVSDQRNMQDYNVNSNVEETMDNIYVAGIDSGSTSTDAVIMDGRKNIVASVIIPTGGGANNSAAEALSQVLAAAGLKKEDLKNIVKTGYGRDYIQEGSGSVTEISCHARGAHYLCPSARTVIDIGGQDSKAIKIDENGAVINFVMNDKCAAGTGRFMEMMARALGLSLEEMSRAGLTWEEDINISSMCTVFAESEVVSLVAQNKKLSDIVRGLDVAVASKVASLAKRVNPEAEYIMTGGVANNDGVVKALEEKLGAGLYICSEAQICGAIGAALFALDKS